MQRRMPFGDRAPLLAPTTPTTNQATKERSMRRSRGCMALVACCTCATMIALIFVVVALGVHARATAHSQCTCAATIDLGATASPLALPPVSASPLSCVTSNVAYTLEVSRSQCKPLTEDRCYIAVAERRVAADDSAPYETIDTCVFSDVAVSDPTLLTYVPLGPVWFALFIVPASTLKGDTFVGATARIDFLEPVGASLISGEYTARTLFVPCPFDVVTSTNLDVAALSAVNWTAALSASTSTPTPRQGIQHHQHHHAVTCEPNFQEGTGALIAQNTAITQCRDACRCDENDSLTVEILSLREIYPTQPGDCVRLRVTVLVVYAPDAPPCPNVETQFLTKIDVTGPGSNFDLSPANTTIFGDGTCVIDSANSFVVCTAQLTGNEVLFEVDFFRPTVLEDPSTTPPDFFDMVASIQPTGVGECRFTEASVLQEQFPLERLQTCDTILGACTLAVQYTIDQTDVTSCTCFDHMTVDDCFVLDFYRVSALPNSTLLQRQFHPFNTCLDVTCDDDDGPYEINTGRCMQFSRRDTANLAQTAIESCANVTVNSLVISFELTDSPVFYQTSISAADPLAVFCDPRTGACVDPNTMGNA